MKKLLSVLAILCILAVGFTSCAGATSTETATTANDSCIRPAQESDEAYSERQEISDQEIRKMDASNSFDEYFGDVVDENDEPVKIADYIDSGDYVVSDFLPAVTNSYTFEDGHITTTLLSQTPYEVGKKVAVLIGHVPENSGADRVVEWVAFPGVGVKSTNPEEYEGAVRVTLDAETVLYIEKNKALLAVAIPVEKGNKPIDYPSAASNSTRKSTPSKTTKDMTKTVYSSVEFPPAEDGAFFRPVQLDETEYQDRLEISDSELQKLGASKKYDDYFGKVVNEYKKRVIIPQMIGTNNYHIYEFLPAIAGGYKIENGHVTAVMLFPTPYTVDEEVLVMIGRVNGNNETDRTVEWTAFAGVGVKSPDAEYEGAIKVTLDAETVQYIENEVALLAIVSK